MTSRFAALGISHVRRVGLQNSAFLAPRSNLSLPLIRSLATFVEKSEATDRILTVVKNFEKVDPKLVTPEAAFKDLSLDSLDIVEVCMAIEEEFAIEIPDAEADKILTIPDAIEYIVQHPMAK
mmetsp:Transcript_12038/g.16286  ORF Transcript_12038/g.16286 Transcript_12038/m.16286 type:complete len:123 (+) Transcript_12038:166-534(+)|eukprot:CAMPEP_0197285736 /NCGR_PEP_ID=MMETSP0890-20130614/1100_1 /TAXON_ID=44058 ORGANISM="Aureoumbra lagunensis, Strain CCMP1510" /NCGR_SAMPLE_ID=MMETSP0890 /ASSEMBLY_ACC=CAM_ASM_000533 /LENGTH=122 /DNA_ID=CAMNT_0042753535 /DNA_START=406 /DNA_END=774 /DNA_ORIENTATION=-